MDSHWNSLSGTRISRREMLQASSCGFGSLGAGGPVGRRGQGTGSRGFRQPSGPESAPFSVPGQADHLSLHARRSSQVDTFDYKPLLQRDHGKPFPYERPRVVSSETFNLLKSPWAFKQYGESGQWVSELFPPRGRIRG